MFVIHYKPHGALHCNAKYIGPYIEFDDAYDDLCKIPALGPNNTGGEAGYKRIVELSNLKEVI